MEPERVAQLLAERLNEVVPSGFRFAAEGGMLWYHTEPAFAGISGSSGTYVRDNYNLNPEDPLQERIRSVCELALDELQDFVDEISTEPWPGVRTVPAAHAEVRGSVVYLWYGDPEAPALQCQPIDLSQATDSWPGDPSPS